MGVRWRLYLVQGLGVMEYQMEKKKWPEQHQQLSAEGFAHRNYMRSPRESQELGSCIFESILGPLYTGAPICKSPLTGDLMSLTAASALHPSP